jgi:hypothetical protein
VGCRKNLGKDRMASRLSVVQPVAAQASSPRVLEQRMDESLARLGVCIEVWEADYIGQTELFVDKVKAAVSHIEGGPAVGNWAFFVE